METKNLNEHVDVTDLNSSRRAVAIFIYLNDNDGKYFVPLHNLNIQPSFW